MGLKLSGKEDLRLGLWIGSLLLLLGLPPISAYVFQSRVREVCQGFVTLDSLCLGSKE